MGPKRSGPREFNNSGGGAKNCRSKRRFYTEEGDQGKWFMTKRRVVWHPKREKWRKMEIRARVGQCVPPGQKRMQEIAERKRQRQELRKQFGGDAAAAMRIQRAIRKYKKRKERAAKRAADRAPREGRTRSQNEQRRSARLRGG